MASNSTSTEFTINVMNIKNCYTSVSDLNVAIESSKPDIITYQNYTITQQLKNTVFDAAKQGNTDVLEQLGSDGRIQVVKKRIDSLDPYKSVGMACNEKPIVTDVMTRQEFIAVFYNPDEFDKFDAMADQMFEIKNHGTNDYEKLSIEILDNFKKRCTAYSILKNNKNCDQPEVLFRKFVWVPLKHKKTGRIFLVASVDNDTNSNNKSENLNAILDFLNQLRWEITRMNNIVDNIVLVIGMNASMDRSAIDKNIKYQSLGLQVLGNQNVFEIETNRDQELVRMESVKPNHFYFIINTDASIKKKEVPRTRIDMILKKPASDLEQLVKTLENIDDNHNKNEGLKTLTSLLKDMQLAMGMSTYEKLLRNSHIFESDGVSYVILNTDDLENADPILVTSILTMTHCVISRRE